MRGARRTEWNSSSIVEDDYHPAVQQHESSSLGTQISWNQEKIDQIRLIKPRAYQDVLMGS